MASTELRKPIAIAETFLTIREQKFPYFEKSSATAHHRMQHASPWCMCISKKGGICKGLGCYPVFGSIGGLHKIKEAASIPYDVQYCEAGGHFSLVRQILLEQYATPILPGFRWSADCRSFHCLAAERKHATSHYHECS